MRVNGLAAESTVPVNFSTMNIPATESSEAPTSDTEQESAAQYQSNADSRDASTMGSTSQPITAITTVESATNSEEEESTTTVGSGSAKNLPYFFQGLQYKNLDPNDPDAHGVAAVCREVQLFSDRKLVAMYPIASTFLVRSLIEQTIMYYSKKHNIQGTNKKIWNEINSISKLSGIIARYKRCLPNYITDSNMQKYFNNLFEDYEKTIDPLNWVVHRPAEFQLNPTTLIELPRNGLLALINYMLSNN